MDADDTLPEDILFLALTRPAMKLGVPVVGFVFNICGSMILGAWLGVGSWHILFYWLVLIPSVHCALRALSAKDYYRFRAVALWVDTKARAMTSHLWGGSSLAPLPSWPSRAREVSLSV